jgi:hypothetical protein
VACPGAATRRQVLTDLLDRKNAIAWGEAEEVRIKQVPVGMAPPPVAAASGLTVADLFERYGREVSPTKGDERWEVIRRAKLAPRFPMLATAVVPGDIARIVTFGRRRSPRPRCGANWN